MSTTTDTRPQETVVSEETAVNIRPINDFSSIETAILAATTDKKRIARARKTYNDLIKAGKGHHAAGREAIKAGLSGLSDDKNKIATANKAAGVTRGDEVKANASSIGAKAKTATQTIKRPATKTEKTEKIETHEENDEKPSFVKVAFYVFIGAFIGCLAGFVLWLIFEFTVGTTRAWNDVAFIPPMINFLLVALAILAGAFGGGYFATKPVRMEEIEYEDEDEDEEGTPLLTARSTRS